MKTISKAAFATALSLILAGISFNAAARGGPVGHAERSFGPNGGGFAQGTRSVTGPAASSSFSTNGPKGNGVSGNASSVVTPNSASGQAHVETTGGRSVDAQGSGKKSGDTYSGQGTVQTSGGYGATGKGEVTKTDTGVSGSGTVTTNSGKTASGSVDGNRDTGTVSVTTANGTKSKSYNNPRY